MGKINVLDKSIAELIAAGEVVERPASVIKELLENSVDAGATAITVEIKNGGVKYIRITDNGSGIMKDDVPKAFLRHATSKVSVANDLDNIATLGFRGEALASICAVAKVQLLTRHFSEDIGTSYEINGGQEVSCGDAGCPKGTTIIVKDIFYNVPARMKFLKRDVAEGNAVANIIDKLALSHSEIAFTFIREGKQVLKTPGDGNLKSAIYSVYGKEFVNKLIPVDYSLNGVQISGYITKPEFARPNRNMQNFFINGRFVKSLTAAKALEEAFKGSIMVGKIPSCVMHISIPCDTVDVNVHPAKTEVRFINERPIFDAVYHGVKTALLKGDTVKEIKLNNSDIIPHKKPNAFSFRQEPYIPKEEDSSQLNLSNVKKYETAPQNNSANIKTAVSGINAETNLGKEATKADTKNESSSSGDEPQLFIPKSKPFVHTESVMTSSLVHDSQAEKFVNPYLQTDIKVNNTEKVNTENITAVEEKPDNNQAVASVTDAESNSYTEGTDSVSGNIENESSDFAEQTAVAYSSKATPQTEPNHSTADVDDIMSEELKYLGEAFSTYILVQKGEDKIVFIDKHAAHERIIYEKLLKEKGKGYMQCLLAPVVVTLPKDEYNAVTENFDRLKEYNFDIDDFGNGRVAVRGVPQYVDSCDIEDMIIEIANNLLEKRKDINTEQMDWVFHSVSCRSAIKAGNINYQQELMEIAKIVDTDKSIRYCPHGRPVCFVITKRELEKQFGRV